MRNLGETPLVPAGVLVGAYSATVGARRGASSTLLRLGIGSQCALGHRACPERGRSDGEWWCVALLVEPGGEAVDADRVGQQVDELSAVADALGVVAAFTTGRSRGAGWDGSSVLGAVELPLVVVVVLRTPRAVLRTRRRTPVTATARSHVAHARSAPSQYAPTATGSPRTRASPPPRSPERIRT